MTSIAKTKYQHKPRYTSRSTVKKKLLADHNKRLENFNWKKTAKSKELSVGGLGNLHGLVNNTLDFDINVSEFELQLNHHVHFRTNILGEGIKFLISSHMFNSNTNVILQKRLWY